MPVTKQTNRVPILAGSAFLIAAIFAPPLRTACIALAIIYFAVAVDQQRKRKKLEVEPGEEGHAPR